MLHRPRARTVGRPKWPLAAHPVWHNAKPTEAGVLQFRILSIPGAHMLPKYATTTLPGAHKQLELHVEHPCLRLVQSSARKPFVLLLPTSRKKPSPFTLCSLRPQPPDAATALKPPVYKNPPPGAPQPPPQPHRHLSRTCRRRRRQRPGPAAPSFYRTACRCHSSRPTWRTRARTRQARSLDAVDLQNTLHLRGWKHFCLAPRMLLRAATRSFHPLNSIDAVISSLAVLGRALNWFRSLPALFGRAPERPSCSRRPCHSPCPHWRDLASFRPPGATCCRTTCTRHRRNSRRAAGPFETPPTPSAAGPSGATNEHLRVLLDDERNTALALRRLPPCACRPCATLLCASAG